MIRVLSRSVLCAIAATFMLSGGAMAENSTAASSDDASSAAAPARKQVQILDTRKNIKVSGQKGQLAHLTNPDTGMKETAVVMETADLESKPIMIAMRLAHPLGEAELEYFDKNKPAAVALSAKCDEVLVAKMPSGRHIAQGNHCSLVDFK
ncbi:hypothetical protein [Thalassospira mesophila]|uniref:Uncharacterized protein n=1 Tax=Thalassospira mesophila TaxID=1293891 RepID=A0A1Y2KXW5_9PROT|nr:hypothetical protein [Thalassospira mesophila]OSQ36146.1 hypothetical protein TMES_18980 [Thalassospira mesophila]